MTIPHITITKKPMKKINKISKDVIYDAICFLKVDNHKEYCASEQQVYMRWKVKTVLTKRTALTCQYYIN